MAEAKPAAGGARARPLSPHLQIYRMTVSMMMSGLHRITGLALYFGAALLAWWLIAAASGPRYFEFVNGLFGTLLGRLVLLGYTWALIHHAIGGIRHFVWDTGKGFELKTVNLMSWLTIILSLTLTVALWGAALTLRGGL